MTIWEWIRVINAVMFLVVCVLFGLVNWKRRAATGKWDVLARFASWAYWLCAAYATADAIREDTPTGPRQLPLLVCLVLITVSYVMLLRDERRKAKC